MQVDVTAPAMVGGQMEDDIDAFHRRARHARLAQVGLHKRDAARLDVLLDVARPAAGEVIHDVHLGAARKQRVHQVRTDERRTPSNENFLMIPDDALHCFRERPSR